MSLRKGYKNIKNNMWWFLLGVIIGIFIGFIFDYFDIRLNK